VFYDNLDAFFNEFDIYNKKEKVFLSTDKRQELIRNSKNNVIKSVKVLKSRIFNSLEEITSLVGKDEFITSNAINILSKEMETFSERDRDLFYKLNKDGLMEGLYIKWEEDGIVKGRYKYVRPDFVQTLIDYGTHWTERKVIKNRTRID
jgi:hypothetical protein